MLHYITTYGLLLFYYSLFFIAVLSSIQSGSSHLKDILNGKGETGVLLSRMLAGIFFLGIGTVNIILKRTISDSVFGTTWHEDQNFLWIIILLIAILLGAITASHKSHTENLTQYFLPLNTALLFLFIRTLFLVVYEFFFRGIVLFIMIEDVGMIGAVAVNIILYGGVHWFNKIERYGSIVMGFILCGTTIYYQSVWPAVFIHLALSLSYEIKLMINNRTSAKKIRL